MTVIASTSVGALPTPASTAADSAAFGDRRDGWDVVELGGRKLPGKAVVSGSGVEHQLDVKKVPGRNGATITDLGRQPGRYEIRLVMWTDEQWKDARALRASLQPTSKDGSLQALDVRHVGLNWLGVSSLYVYGVGVPQPGAQPGTVEVTLRCLEFRKEDKRSATKTILGSKTITAAADPNAANMSTPDGRMTRVEHARPSRQTGPDEIDTSAVASFPDDAPAASFPEEG